MLAKPLFGLCPPDFTANGTLFVLSSAIMVDNSSAELGLIMQGGVRALQAVDLIIVNVCNMYFTPTAGGVLVR